MVLEKKNVQTMVTQTDLLINRKITYLHNLMMGTNKPYLTIISSDYKLLLFILNGRPDLRYRSDVRFNRDIIYSLYKDILFKDKDITEAKKDLMRFIKE